MALSQSDIQIQVTLDKDKIPESITWTASDMQDNATQDAKAMLLAFFDRETKDTLKIDLWTKDMEVGEMDRFVFQTLQSLSETYQRATSNAQLADALKQFSRYFGEEVELIKRSE